MDRDTLRIAQYLEAYGSGSICTRLSYRGLNWEENGISNSLAVATFHEIQYFKNVKSLRTKKFFTLFFPKYSKYGLQSSSWGSGFRGNFSEIFFLFFPHVFRLIYHCNPTFHLYRSRTVDWGNLTFAEYTPVSLSGQSKLHKYGVVYWYWWHFVIRIVFIESLTLWRGFLSVGGWVCEDSMFFVLSPQLSIFLSYRSR